MERAKHTERHNDRSMYPEMNKDTNNIYWTCYGKDVGFAEAERRYFDEHYSENLNKTNEYYLANGKADRYRDMKQYHLDNMPYEMIIQIGNKDVQPDDAASFLEEYADALLVSLEETNVDVISYAVHIDESTPHLHIRYIGNGLDGKPNMNEALRPHYKTPLEYACIEAGLTHPQREENEKQKDFERRCNAFAKDNADALYPYCPYLFTEEKNGTLNFKSRTNTVKTAFQMDIRNTLEQEVEERYKDTYGVDRNRSKRGHLTVDGYKALKNAEASNMLSRRNKKLKANEKALQSKDEELNKRASELTRREADLQREKEQLRQREAEFDEKWSKLTDLNNTVSKRLERIKELSKGIKYDDVEYTNAISIINDKNTFIIKDGKQIPASEQFKKWVKTDRDFEDMKFRLEVDSNVSEPVSESTYDDNYYY